MTHLVLWHVQFWLLSFIHFPIIYFSQLFLAIWVWLQTESATDQLTPPSPCVVLFNSIGTLPGVQSHSCSLHTLRISPVVNPNYLEGPFVSPFAIMHGRLSVWMLSDNASCSLSTTVVNWTEHKLLRSHKVCQKDQVYLPGPWSWLRTIM